MMKNFIDKLIERLKKLPHAKEDMWIWLIDAEVTIRELAEEYKSDWIPCSERLPEVNGWYLVTNELGVVQQQHWGASHWEKLRDDAVIAWMPLPAPYTEGE